MARQGTARLGRARHGEARQGVLIFSTLQGYQQMFEIKRQDGRSNAQVLIDAVKNDPPGKVYPYDELQKILDKGTVSATRSIVINAQHRLLKEYNRTLVNVRGVGYRMAEASQHSMLATARKRKAETQVRKGLHLLNNVNWDEMEPAARDAHMGTLMVMQGMYASQKAHEKRTKAVEDSIAAIHQRIDTIESKS